MRRAYIHLAGNLSGWPFGTTPTPAMMKKFDQFSSELVNGEEGGFWEPESPIVVGPSGSVYPTGAVSDDTRHPADVELGNATEFTGDIETVKGNRDHSDIHPGGIYLLNGVLPTFETARTRSIVVPFTCWSERGDTVRYGIDPLYLAPRTIDGGAATRGQVVLPIRAQHRHSTISSVTFRFLIGRHQKEVPFGKPRFRVVRCHANNLIEPLHTATGDYAVEGWLTDPVTTAATYYNSGRTRTLTYVPDQFNVNIDTEVYFYAVQWLDQTGGPLAKGNVFLSATVELTNIATMGPE